MERDHLIKQISENLSYLTDGDLQRLAKKITRPDPEKLREEISELSKKVR